jgi:hypothetical protein
MPTYPSDYQIPPFQLRRGSLAQVTNYVPAQGELVFSTSTNQVYVGDGNTVGGILVAGGGAGGDLDFGTFTAPAGFTLDLGTF